MNHNAFGDCPCGSRACAHPALRASRHTEASLGARRRVRGGAGSRRARLPLRSALRARARSPRPVSFDSLRRGSRSFVCLIAFPRRRPGFSRGLAWIYLFLATASHGLLDCLTNGGLGVALFSPFDARRYFFAFRPIEVSPLGVREFISERGVAVLQSELVWVWLPCAIMAALLVGWKRWRRSLAGRRPTAIG